MNKPRTIEGRWWIHGNDKPPQFGILSFDPETGFELSVKIPQSRTSDEHFISLLDSTNEEVQSTIHGANENALPVTLFGCSIRKWSKGAGLDSYQIHCQAVITNYSGHSWDEAQFPVVGIKYTLLNAWMNRRLLKQRGEDEKEKIEDEIKNGYISYDFQLNDILEFELSREVQIKIQGTTAPSFSVDEMTFRLVHTLYFVFAKPLSAQKVYDDYILVFLRLLSLLTGEQIFAEEITLFDRDPFKLGHGNNLQQYELLIENHGITEAKRDVHGGNMIANYAELAADFGSVLKRWFECHEQLKPVLDLYFAVLANWVLTDQSRFLFLAQALEVYHARSTRFTSTEKPEAEHQQRLKTILESVQTKKYRDWLEYRLKFSNEKALSRRIDEILKLHGKESAQLTAKINDFADKVRDSRNYYTHYSEKTFQGGKVASGLELRRMVYALHGLLQVCLLKELGIEGKPIERILERNNSIKWADLKTETKS
jgi:hypothetical protein